MEPSELAEPYEDDEASSQLFHRLQSEWQSKRKSFSSVNTMDNVSHNSSTAIASIPSTSHTGSAADVMRTTMTPIASQLAMNDTRQRPGSATKKKSIDKSQLEYARRLYEEAAAIRSRIDKAKLSLESEHLETLKRSSYVEHLKHVKRPQFSMERREGETVHEKIYNSGLKWLAKRDSSVERTRETMRRKKEEEEIASMKPTPQLSTSGYKGFSSYLSHDQTFEALYRSKDLYDRRLQERARALDDDRKETMYFIPKINQMSSYLAEQRRMNRSNQFSSNSSFATTNETDNRSSSTGRHSKGHSRPRSRSIDSSRQSRGQSSLVIDIESDDRGYTNMHRMRPVLNAVKTVSTPRRSGETRSVASTPRSHTEGVSTSFKTAPDGTNLVVSPHWGRRGRESFQSTSPRGSDHQRYMYLQATPKSISKIHGNDGSTRYLNLDQPIGDSSVDNGRSNGGKSDGPLNVFIRSLLKGTEGQGHLPSHPISDMIHPDNAVNADAMQLSELDAAPSLNEFVSIDAAASRIPVPNRSRIRQSGTSRSSMSRPRSVSVDTGLSRRKTDETVRSDTFKAGSLPSDEDTEHIAPDSIVNASSAMNHDGLNIQISKDESPIPDILGETQQCHDSPLAQTVSVFDELYEGRETSRVILQEAVRRHSRQFPHTPDIGINRYYAVEKDRDQFVQRLFDHTKIHDDRIEFITKEIIRQERGESIHLTNEEKDKLFDKLSRQDYQAEYLRQMQQQYERSQEIEYRCKVSELIPKKSSAIAIRKQRQALNEIFDVLVLSADLTFNIWENVSNQQSHEEDRQKLVVDDLTTTDATVESKGSHERSRNVSSSMNSEYLDTSLAQPDLLNCPELAKAFIIILASVRPKILQRKEFIDLVEHFMASGKIHPISSYLTTIIDADNRSARSATTPRKPREGPMSPYDANMKKHYDKSKEKSKYLAKKRYARDAQLTSIDNDKNDLKVSYLQSPAIEDRLLRYKAILSDHKESLARKVFSETSRELTFAPNIHASRASYEAVKYANIL